MEYIFTVKILLFSLIKIVDMISQGEFLEQKKLICNPPNDIISGNFISEKLMTIKILTIKIYYIYS